MLMQHWVHHEHEILASMCLSCSDQMCYVMIKF